MKVITFEQAEADLRRVQEQFKALGQGTELERVAQLVLQTLQVLRNRLDQRGTIRLLYLNNPRASALLPPVVLETAKKLCADEVSVKEAEGIIDEAIQQYNAVFEKMGLIPQRPEVLIMKR